MIFIVVTPTRSLSTDVNTERIEHYILHKLYMTKYPYVMIHVVIDFRSMISIAVRVLHSR